MRRGPWHQLGDRSQTIAAELLATGAGVGVIISPRDLAFHNAIQRAQQYHEQGAQVLVDPQFYIPHFANPKIESYPTAASRATVSELRRIGDAQLEGLAAQLRQTNTEVLSDGIIAPAVIYEAASPGIEDLNGRLFDAANAVGRERCVPVYATVALGRSVTGSSEAVNVALSHATSLAADGWYFAYEFEAERVPSSANSVYLCCKAGLTLATTGKPVLHAFAGPLALLSFAFGATGAGVGHSQNLWRFSPTRFQTAAGQGGGGDAPPRLFSEALWGTLVHPDDTARLPRELAEQILTPSPFTGGGATPPRDWSRWDSHKHLVYTICRVVGELAAVADPREVAHAACRRLQAAMALYVEMEREGVPTRDNADAYQRHWAAAITDLLEGHGDDYDFLGLL